MAFISWEDVQEGGYQFGTYWGNAVKKAQSGVCNLYRNYPSWSTFLTVPGSPAETAARGFYDSVCGKEPGGLPPPPSPPFQGGQCPCVLYNVTFERRNYSSSGTVTINTSVAFNVPGKIAGVQKILLSNGAVDYKILAGSEGCPYEGYVVRSTSANSDCFVKSVVRSDGKSDTCGNPPVDWNPTAKGNPPLSETNKTEPISDSGGNTFPVAFVYAPITPTLNVNVDVGGVTLQLDLGGVTIAPEINIDGSVGDAPPPPSSNPGVEDELNEIADSLDEIAANQSAQNEDLDAIKDALDKLKEEQERQKQPEVDEQNKEEPPQEEDEKEEERDDLAAVRIVITQLPNKGTIQYSGSKVGWMAAGWFYWKVKPGSCPVRYPIHLEDNIYHVLPGVVTTGYGFVLTNGAKCRVIIYKKSELVEE